MLFSDSVTAVTKIVLRSQWGWWGGVKKLFKWINSPSDSGFFFPPRCSSWKCGYPGHVWQVHVHFSLLRMCSQTTSGCDVRLSCIMWPCRIQRHLLVRRYSRMLRCSPGSGAFSMSGISSTSFTPFSHHLPRRLCRIRLLASPPLMPFSIDHYPSLPSPLLAIAQSEMWPPHGPRWVAVAHGRWRGFDWECLAVYFDLIYGVPAPLRIIGEFVLPLRAIRL